MDQYPCGPLIYIVMIASWAYHQQPLLLRLQPAAALRRRRPALVRVVAEWRRELRRGNSPPAAAAAAASHGEAARGPVGSPFNGGLGVHSIGQYHAHAVLILSLFF